MPTSHTMPPAGDRAPVSARGADRIALAVLLLGFSLGGAAPAGEDEAEGPQARQGNVEPFDLDWLEPPLAGSLLEGDPPWTWDDLARDADRCALKERVRIADEKGELVFESRACPKGSRVPYLHVLRRGVGKPVWRAVEVNELGDALDAAEAFRVEGRPALLIGVSSRGSDAYSVLVLDAGEVKVLAFHGEVAGRSAGPIAPWDVSVEKGGDLHVRVVTIRQFEKPKKEFHSLVRPALSGMKVLKTYWRKAPKGR